jgi:hypothetical protein
VPQRSCFLCCSFFTSLAKVTLPPMLSFLLLSFFLHFLNFVFNWLFLFSFLLFLLRYLLLYKQQQREFSQFIWFSVPGSCSLSALSKHSPKSMC